MSFFDKISLRGGTWDIVYFGNTVGDYVLALFFFLVIFLVLKLIQDVVVVRLRAIAERTKTDIDDMFIQVVQSLRPRFYSFLALYLALRTLDIHELFVKILTVVVIIWVVYQLVDAVQVVISYVVQKRVGAEEDRSAKTATTALGLLSKILLWSLAFLFVLSNLGVNITSLIAGLGIGGIAIAFALQNILADLFSSFAIYFDKPFMIGDFIIVGNHMGVVENVGIKTTRLRALQGEEIVISNAELTSTRIQNFKNMKERRIVFSFGVIYETSDEKMKKIPDMVKSVIESVDNVRFDRAHFKNFGPSSLDFEAVYYVQTGDYNEYMTINQKIHLGIKEQFGKEDIDMAYPTQTLYVHNT